MALPERAIWLAVSLGLAAALFSTRRPPAAAPTNERPRAAPGMRVSMAALHQQGGVPLGWQPAVAPGNPEAGRTAFVELGCPACHRVLGEAFAAANPNPMGPELTGMGSHHPPAYFAEAILNPDAVLIDEPGYIDDSGHSIMPIYDGMTVGQLSDLVAYLGSLTTDGLPSCHSGGALPVETGFTVAPLPLQNRPAPVPAEAQAFFAQTYDLRPGQLAAFESWFATDGRAGFLASAGLVSLDTFVDLARPATPFTTSFGFRDEAALRNFLGDPGMVDLWKQFDGFVGAHGHYTTRAPLTYRASSLSMEVGDAGTGSGAMSRRHDSR